MSIETFSPEPHSTCTITACPDIVPNTWIPEKRLWQAVLEEAIQTAAGKGSYVTNLEIHTAQRWFKRRFPAGRAPAGSFDFCCLVLDLEAEVIRKQLKRYCTQIATPKEIARAA
jgi:hypothetical protein